MRADGKQYRTQIASARFVDVVRERLGAAAAREWRAFQNDVNFNFGSAGAVQPMAVRLDNRALSCHLRRCAPSARPVRVICVYPTPSAPAVRSLRAPRA